MLAERHPLRTTRRGRSSVDPDIAALMQALAMLREWTAATPERPALELTGSDVELIVSEIRKTPPGTDRLRVAYRQWAWRVTVVDSDLVTWLAIHLRDTKPPAASDPAQTLRAVMRDRLIADGVIDDESRPSDPVEPRYQRVLALGIAV